ncbi:helix-turn-helix transcriptional regulator [Lonepinella sp. BR2882]|uniref:helix-turn-helix transcriptional regulator n=1 Tax=Lonepinella sp. BR2882 TaxID=3095283 RepID=UPI003F6E3429
MSKNTNNKNRQITGKFIAIPNSVLDSLAYRSLTGNETKVFIHLCRKYNGTNNGNLVIPYNTVEKDYNLSRQTLFKCLKSLEEKGFIETSRQGRKGVLSLYAVTIYRVDECLKNGYSTHDLKPTIQAKHSWKHYNDKLKSQSNNTKPCK